MGKGKSQKGRHYLGGGRSSSPGCESDSFVSLRERKGCSVCDLKIKVCTDVG